MAEKTLTGADEDKADEKDDIAVVEVDAKGQPIVEEDSRVDAGAGDKEADDKETGDKESDDGKPERRRETHQERRERWRKARERDQREMQFLRSYVGKLEQKVENLSKVTTETRAMTIDERLSEALNDAETAEKIMAAAISANNGEDAVKAERLRDEARDRARQLHAQKQQVQQQAKPEPPPYLPFAKKFAEDKPWFTWDQSDPDSKTVLMLDNAVAKEGYDPSTPAYWQELDRRVRKNLPHHFKKRRDDLDDGFEEEDEYEAPRRRGPMVGSGREHVPPSTRREVNISPERKAAMIEAGVWDDPVLRKKYAKRYAEWDREHSARR